MFLSKTIFSFYFFPSVISIVIQGNTVPPNDVAGAADGANIEMCKLLPLFSFR